MIVATNTDNENKKTRCVLNEDLTETQSLQKPTTEIPRV